MALLNAPSCGSLMETALFWNKPIPVTAPFMLYLPSGPASKFVGGASWSGPMVEGVGNGAGAVGAVACVDAEGVPAACVASSGLLDELSCASVNPESPTHK